MHWFTDVIKLMEKIKLAGPCAIEKIRYNNPSSFKNKPGFHESLIIGKEQPKPDKKQLITAWMGICN